MKLEEAVQKYKDKASSNVMDIVAGNVLIVEEYEENMAIYQWLNELLQIKRYMNYQDGYKKGLADGKAKGSKEVIEILNKCSYFVEHGVDLNEYIGSDKNAD